MKFLTVPFVICYMLIAAGQLIHGWTPIGLGAQILIFLGWSLFNSFLPERQFKGDLIILPITVFGGWGAMFGAPWLVG